MTTYCTIGIRIHADNEQPIQEYYLNNMLHWLQYRKYDIQYYTAGIHLDTENPHIHIHAVAYTMEEGAKPAKALSNPVATMKYDYAKDKVGIVEGTAVGYEYPNSPVGQKYRNTNRINISIQMTDQGSGDEGAMVAEANINRWLGYPLKEGRLLQSNHPSVEELMKRANEEYIEAKAKYDKEQTKKEIKEARETSEWEKYCNYLDEKNVLTLEDAFRHSVRYYRENYNKPPTGKYIADNAERYCIKHEILTEEHLIQKYIGRY